MVPTNLSREQVNKFNKDGYVIIKGFCSQQEVTKLYSAGIDDESRDDSSLGLNSFKDEKSKIDLWFTPGNDVFGYLSRSEKMVHSVAQFLDSNTPVCHVQSKLMQKKPGVGGVWEWHQDYGYWYKNQFMFPNQMVSVMVALTPTDKTNGCSQIIKGSHKLGRLNHSFTGKQAGADRIKVNNALKKMELVYPELEAGDALFFHSNLLHRSEANLSEHSTWSIVSCFSSQSNLAHKQIFTSWHTPINMVPNEAILNWDPQYISETIFPYNGNIRSFKKTG